MNLDAGATLKSTATSSQCKDMEKEMDAFENELEFFVSQPLESIFQGTKVIIAGSEIADSVEDVAHTIHNSILAVKNILPAISALPVIGQIASVAGSAISSFEPLCKTFYDAVVKFNAAVTDVVRPKAEWVSNQTETAARTVSAAKIAIKKFFQYRLFTADAQESCQVATRDPCNTGEQIFKPLNAAFDGLKSGVGYMAEKLKSIASWLKKLLTMAATAAWKSLSAFFKRAYDMVKPFFDFEAGILHSKTEVKMFRMYKLHWVHWMYLEWVFWMLGLLWMLEMYVW